MMTHHHLLAKGRGTVNNFSHSVVSNSLRPQGLQPTRLLHPWNSPGKKTGVGCHSLLQGIFPTQGLNPVLPHCQRRQWHPTPVLLPGKSHGWRSLVGCSPWGREESDMTEPSIQYRAPVHSEGDQPWDFFGRNDAKAETPVLWPPHAKN